MNKQSKPAAEYTRWAQILHFGHLSLPEFKLHHGIGTQASLQPPFQEIKNDSKCIVQMEQIHGIGVRWVDDCPSEPVAKMDALATTQARTALVLRTADCVPVLLFDPGTRLVAVVHVGWRGLAAGIIQQTSTVLQEHGSKPADWLVGIGPAICQACYEIDREVKEALVGATTILSKGEKWTVDLQKEVENGWLAQGVEPQKIEIMRLCTKEHSDQFPSFRRDKTNQRFYSYIRLEV